MKLIKRNPKQSQPVGFFGENFNDMFEGFFRPISTFSEAGHTFPTVDIDENKEHYVLKADLPGFDKKEVKVEFNNGTLEIKAEHSEEIKEKKEGDTLLSERYYGSFYRSFNFGDNVVAEDISADFDNGVLTLNMPKAPEAQNRVRNIEIR